MLNSTKHIFLARFAVLLALVCWIPEPRAMLDLLEIRVLVPANITAGRTAAHAYYLAPAPCPYRVTSDAVLERLMAAIAARMALHQLAIVLL